MSLFFVPSSTAEMHILISWKSRSPKAPIFFLWISSPFILSPCFKRFLALDPSENYYNLGLNSGQSVLQLICKMFTCEDRFCCARKSLCCCTWNPLDAFIYLLTIMLFSIYLLLPILLHWLWLFFFFFLSDLWFPSPLCY